MVEDIVMFINFLIKFSLKDVITNKNGVNNVIKK